VPYRRGSRTGLSQLERMQGIQWGDGVRNDRALWFDGDGVYTDGSLHPRGPSPWVDVTSFGVLGNGLDDDRQTILDAEAALGSAGGTLFFPPGTYKTAASVTLLPTTHVRFAVGAVLAPAAATVFTIAGSVKAGLHKIFQTGAGTFAFARSQPIYPEWWGALADVKTAQTGGAITSGQTTLTTGGTFDGSDVGKLAVVLGAGASGAPLITTVAAFVSATQVTLAAAASTTVSTSRWAIGSDSTTALNACLVAAAGGTRVILSGLYGTTGVLLNGGQIVIGSHLENTGFYRLAAGAGAGTLSLNTGVSGDNLRLSGFLVNNMFVGTYDGVEIGTANHSLALASGGFIRDVKVRNAAGWGFNVRCNVATFHNLWSQHDVAPPASNTTAGGMKFIDTLAYADMLAVEGSYPAGPLSLGAGGGSVFDGLQLELSGTYASVDVITVAGNQQIINGVYATLGTQRDLIRISAGVRDIDVNLISIKGSHTLTNVLNDIDRAVTIAPSGTDFAYPRYWTTNNVGLTSHDGGGAWKIRKTAAPDLILSDSNAYSNGVQRTVAVRAEALNPSSSYLVAGGIRIGVTPIGGRTNLDAEVVIETQDSSVGTLFDALTCDLKGNVVLGTAALATNATDRFLYIPTCAGTPTGTPTAKTGRFPLVYDSTNGVLYVYNGTAWVAVVDQAAWTAFTPTWTGFSVNPAVTSRYKQVGKTVVWSVGVTAGGTSNATTLTVSLPLNARSAQAGIGYGYGLDNGAQLATPVRIDLGTGNLAFYTTPAGGAWTATGTKWVAFTIVYEAA